MTTKEKHNAIMGEYGGMSAALATQVTNKKTYDKLMDIYFKSLRNCNSTEANNNFILLINLLYKILFKDDNRG